MAVFIRECLDPTQPVMDCKEAGLFGAPRGRIGRFLPNTVDEIPISAIAVHCVKGTYESYIASVCVGLTKIPVECHASMHYVIDAETGAITSLVSEANLAWAFQSYRSNFPTTSPVNGCPCPTPCPVPPCGEPLPAQTYPGWPVLSAEFPNISADFYAINIAVVNTSRLEDSFLDDVQCCLGPYGMSEFAYAQLIHLIAWIQSRYAAILLDDQHIKFHDDIVPTEAGCAECSCGANGSCLVCDISSYCERCINPPDPAIALSDSLFYVYGESSGGCKVKLSLDDFKALLGL